MAMNAKLFFVAFGIGCAAVAAVGGCIALAVALGRVVVRRRAVRVRTIVLRDAELIAFAFDGGDVVLDLVGDRSGAKPRERGAFAVRVPASTVDLDLLARLDAWAHSAATLDVQVAYGAGSFRAGRVAVPTPN
jgi:hypothetical protein